MRDILKGSTDQSTIVRIVDSADGTPETGVTSATSGLDLKYRREGATAVSLTESDLAGVDSAHSDGGMIHLGAGYYRIDLPDAAFASGVNGVLTFGTVTGMVVIGSYHQLVDFALAGQSAIDLKDFADDGYDPSTNKVQGVVTTDVATVVNGLAANTLTASALNADFIAELFGTAVAEAYPADGAAATVAELLYLLLSVCAEFSISSTTLTAKKLDGSTTAATYTLNDASNPTSRTRAT